MAKLPPSPGTARESAALKAMEEGGDVDPQVALPTFLLRYWL